MTKFLTNTFYAFIVNAVVIDEINMIIGFPMTEINVIVWAVASALIGMTLAYAIRYAVKLAKEHQA